MIFMFPNYITPSIPFPSFGSFRPLYSGLTEIAFIALSTLLYISLAKFLEGKTMVIFFSERAKRTTIRYVDFPVPIGAYTMVTLLDYIISKATFSYYFLVNLFNLLCFLGKAKFFISFLLGGGFTTWTIPLGSVFLSILVSLNSSKRNVVPPMFI